MSTKLHSNLDSIKEHLLTLCGVVEESVQKAVIAVQRLDAGLGREVMAADAYVDAEEVAIEEECLKVLATQQPVAGDLRLVVGILKVNNDLERIGDLAVNIALRAKYLSAREPLEIPFDFQAMAEKTRGMLRDCIDALIKENMDLANKVLKDDDEVDRINREMYDKVFDAVKKDPDRVASYVHYLSVSRQLERIADYTTNIAEDVIYMVSGELSATQMVCLYSFFFVLHTILTFMT